MVYDVHVMRRQGRWEVAIEGLLRPWSHHADHDDALRLARSRSAWYGSRLVDHETPRSIEADSVAPGG